MSEIQFIYFLGELNRLGPKKSTVSLLDIQNAIKENTLHALMRKLGIKTVLGNEVLWNAFVQHCRETLADDEARNLDASSMFDNGISFIIDYALLYCERSYKDMLSDKVDAILKGQ